MSLPVVLIADKLAESTVAALGDQVEVRWVDGPDREKLLAAVPEADALLVRSATTVDAEVVVVGIGVIPNTDWLAGSGLLIEDGVLCDETTLAAPGVVACNTASTRPTSSAVTVRMRSPMWTSTALPARKPAPSTWTCSPLTCTWSSLALPP